MNNPGGKGTPKGTSWERGSGGDLTSAFGASAGTSNDGSSNQEEGSNVPRNRESSSRARSAGGNAEKGLEDVVMDPAHGDPESAKVKDKPRNVKSNSDAGGAKKSAT